MKNKDNNIKPFIYDGSVKQQEEVICYSFSDELLDASENELKEFISILSKHYPKTERSDGKYKIMSNQNLLNTY